MSDKKKPSEKKKSYTLKKPVSIKGEKLYPGQSIELTLKEAQIFKSKNRI